MRPNIEDSGMERPLPLADTHFDWPDWYCQKDDRIGEADWLFMLMHEIDGREFRNEYRPRASKEPTLASGSEARPPAGASDDGVAGIIASRMVGNGETYPLNDLGGEWAEPPAFTPVSISPFHASEVSDD